MVNHHSLPDWLQDNDFLHKGHRVPTNSFRECFKSIFRIHTETGNIWSHLLGNIYFIFKIHTETIPYGKDMKDMKQFYLNLIYKKKKDLRKQI